MEHERDVLENEPSRAAGVHQPEDVIDQHRALATDAGGTTGLAQVLAREAGADYVRIGRQALEITNVRMNGNIGDVY